MREASAGRELVILVRCFEATERKGGDTVNEVTDEGEGNGLSLSDFEGEVGGRAAKLDKSPTDSVTLFQLPCKSFWAGFPTAGSVYVVDIASLEMMD